MNPLKHSDTEKLQRARKAAGRWLITTMLILNSLLMVPAAVAGVMTGNYTASIVGICLGAGCWLTGWATVRAWTAARRERCARRSACL
jgi:hypothetical protein